MNDVANFGAILRRALRDPETIDVFRGILEPMMEDQTKKLKKEIRSIKVEVEQVKQKTDDLEKRVGELEIENKDLSQTIQHQQKFLESLDYDQRKHNMIMMGLGETEPIITEDEVELTTDAGKINHILRKIGQNDIGI